MDATFQMKSRRNLKLLDIKTPKPKLKQTAKKTKKFGTGV